MTVNRKLFSVVTSPRIEKLVGRRNTQTQNPQAENTQIQSSQSPKIPKIELAILTEELTAYWR